MEGETSLQQYDLSSTAACSAPQAPTATQVALNIPEILLKILCHSDTSHFPAFALVCRAFTSPAYSLLYEQLFFNWHPVTLESIIMLLRSFDLNPDLYALVKSVQISFEREGPREQGASWTGTDGGERKLGTFLGHVHRLRQLQLHSLPSTEETPPLSGLIQKNIEAVIGGLLSLQLVDVASAFWMHLCGFATSLDQLDLIFSQFPSFIRPLPPLRHLEIAPGNKTLEEFGPFLSRFSKTLETLHLTWGIGNDWRHNSPQIGSTLDKLTYLRLYSPANYNPQPIQSLLKSTPCVRFLRWENDWNVPSLLPLIIPLLPSSVTMVETVCWLEQPLSFVNVVLEASSKRPRAPQFTLHIYLKGLAREKITELTDNALSQGVRLEIFDREDYGGMPSLLELWQDERRN